jgi:hypothetical protein
MGWWDFCGCACGLKRQPDGGTMTEPVPNDTADRPEDDDPEALAGEDVTDELTALGWDDL